MSNSLPDKPSELIRAALQDLSAIENNPSYVVNMEVYHTPYKDDDNRCHVCLAGSVMANRFKENPLRQLFPIIYDTVIFSKLVALNEFRLGNIFQGLCVLDIFDARMLFDSPLPVKWDITPYEVNPLNFKYDMYTLADRLDKEGL